MDNLIHLSWAFKPGLFNCICMRSFTTKSALEAALSMIEKQVELQLNLHILLFSRCLKIFELLSDSKCCLRWQLPKTLVTESLFIFTLKMVVF